MRILLALLALLNLGAAAAVLLRRFFKHWYLLAQDEQRLEAAAYVERALEQLRQGRVLPAPPSRRLAENELLRRLPQAAPEEQDGLQQLFRQWRLRDDRIRRLRRGPPWQRAQSAMVLGRMQTREALPEILKLLAQDNTEMRLAALRALELLGDPKAIDALVNVLPAVKDTAWRMVWAALIACARAQPERLRAHLAHPEPRVREVVAAVLGELNSPALLDALLAHANDPHPGVRARLACALGRSGSTRALPLLSERAWDPVWYVRLHAVGALGALGDREAHELLALAVRDPNLQVRQKAAAALCLLWRDPIYLINLLCQGAPDRYALGAVVSELDWSGVTWEAINRVNAPLPGLRQQSRELVERLISVGAYAPVLYAIETHPDTQVRRVLLELVARALPQEDYPALVEVLGSPYLDAGTRRAIKKLVGAAVEAGDDLG
ncbi:MAG: HEAT repeat domain-containing protein [Terriglobia bacterium]